MKKNSNLSSSALTSFFTKSLFIIKNKQQVLNRRFYEDLSNQQLPTNDIKHNQIIKTNASFNIQNVQNQLKIKLKVLPFKNIKANSRDNKFIKEENKINNIKNNNQNELILKLKQKTLKKMQLMQRLRQIDNQLLFEKKSLNKQNNSLQKSNQNPQQSVIKISQTSSYLTPRERRPQSFITDYIIKQNNIAYSSSGHESAYKLIQKINTQKRKKHQRLLIEIKQKQQKSINNFIQVQEQKKKQIQLKKLKQSINLRVRKTINNQIRNDSKQSKTNIINTLTKSNLQQLACQSPITQLKQENYQQIDQSPTLLPINHQTHSKYVPITQQYQQFAAQLQQSQDDQLSLSVLNQQINQKTILIE